MYAEAFPAKLKAAREKAGYRQTDVTEETGIPQCNISNYETGRTQPDFETLGILADLYEVSIDWLLSTKGNNTKNK